MKAKCCPPDLNRGVHLANPDCCGLSPLHLKVSTWTSSSQLKRRPFIHVEDLAGIWATMTRYLPVFLVVFTYGVHPPTQMVFISRNSVLSPLHLKVSTWLFNSQLLGALNTYWEFGRKMSNNAKIPACATGSGPLIHIEDLAGRWAIMTRYQPVQLARGPWYILRFRREVEQQWQEPACAPGGV